MNPTYDNVTVNNEISFPSYNTTSSIVIARTAGLTRNSTTQQTLLPFDVLQVTKAIISLTKLQAPTCIISNLLTSTDITTGGLTLNGVLTLQGGTTITQQHLSSLLGVSSNLQIQLNNKLNLSGGTLTGTLTAPNLTLTGDLTLQSGTNITQQQLASLSGVSSNIQSQLNGKLSTSGGTVSGILTTNGFNVNFTSSFTGSATFSDQIWQNGPSASDRQIYSWYYNIGDESSLANGSNARLYSAGDTFYVQNLKNLSTSSIAFTISTGTNTSVIPMTIKKNSIVIKSKCDVSAGTATPTFEIMDDNVPNDRGVIFIPNAAGGAFNSLVSANDQVICGRRMQNNMSLTMTLWASTGCGIRLSALTPSTASVTLRASNNTIVISESTTTPILFNNRLTFATGVSSARRIDSVSVIGFRDTQGTGGGAAFELYTSSAPTPPMTAYVNYTDDYVHNFFTSSSGSQSSKFTIGPSNITSLAPHYFTSTTSTTRLEINTASTGVTTITGTNSSSLNNNLVVKLKNSAGTTNTQVTISPTAITETVPRDTTAVTTRSSNHVGYVGYFSPGPTILPNNTTVGPILNFTLEHPGVYIINLSMDINNTDGTNPAEINDISYGMSKISTTQILGGIEGTLRFKQKGYNHAAIEVPSNQNVTLSTCCNTTTTTTNQVIYINGFMSYSFSSSMDIRPVVSWVKIA
jgi:hypothetical protein